MFASLILALASLAPPTISDEAALYSVWMQQACRIQQVGHSGGEPADHVEFCACFDGTLQFVSNAATYRVLALGSQGALQEQSLIEDWEAARDTAVTEAAAMSLEDQAEFVPLLQNALMSCMHLSYQGE